jgi:hypothetical protein
MFVSVELTCHLNCHSCIFHYSRRRSRSRSYFMTDSQSVCLGIEHPCGTCNQILLPVGVLLSEICDLISVSSLVRGRVCNLQCNHSMVRVAQNP